MASNFVATPFFHVLRAAADGSGVATFTAPAKLGTYVIRWAPSSSGGLARSYCGQIQIPKACGPPSIPVGPQAYALGACNPLLGARRGCDACCTCIEVASRHRPLPVCWHGKSRP